MATRHLAKYSPVEDLENIGEGDVFLDDETKLPGPERSMKRPPKGRARFDATPWMLTAFFALLSLYLFVKQQVQSRQSPLGTYEEGFYTDAIPGKRIPLEKVTFTRSPMFNGDGDGSLPPVDPDAAWPDNLVLFGEPSHQIDANWKKYIGGRYFSLTEEEITNAVGKERIHEFIDHYRGGYSAGLDVFHTLHCVNSLRRMFHPKYYNISVEKSTFHTEHCLDAIRRHIQCYGSTTLIPTNYWEGLHHNYINTDVTHTCRSFNFLRDFTKSRMDKGENYVHRDRTLIDQDKHKKAVQWHKENPDGGH